MKALWFLQQRKNIITMAIIWVISGWLSITIWFIPWFNNFLQWRCYVHCSHSHWYETYPISCRIRMEKEDLHLNSVSEDGAIIPGNHKQANVIREWHWTWSPLQPFKIIYLLGLESWPIRVIYFLSTIHKSMLDNSLEI